MSLKRIAARDCGSVPQGSRRSDKPIALESQSAHLHVWKTDWNGDHAEPETKEKVMKSMGPGIIFY